VERMAREELGLRKGVQIRKSSSTTLEAPRLEIKSFIQRIDKET